MRKLGFMFMSLLILGCSSIINKNKVMSGTQLGKNEALVFLDSQDYPP